MLTPYDKDPYAWSYEQAGFLRRKEYHKLDFENLIEELECLGRSEKRTLRSYLEILLMHMLKKEFQPEKKTRSWDLSIKNSRIDANTVLKENPSLKHKLPEIFKEAYKKAILGAALETGLEEKVFPKKCPWEIEEILEKKI
jgi:hypothetical protein